MQKHTVARIAAILLLLVNGAVFLAAVKQWQTIGGTSAVFVGNMSFNHRAAATLESIDSLEEAKRFASRLIVNKAESQAADEQLLFTLSRTHEQTLGAAVLVLAFAMVLSTVIATALLPLSRAARAE